MDALTIVLISICVVIFLLIIGLGVLYWILLLRKSTYTHFFTNDGKMLNKRFGKLLSKNFEYEKQTYIIDEKCIKYVKGKPHLFYILGNPEPLMIDTSDARYAAKIKSQDLNAILKSDLIQKLFSTDNLAKIGIILEVIILIFVIIAIIVIASKGTGRVELAETANNTLVIKNAVIEAIKMTGR